jgi:hypothetical protein
VSALATNIIDTAVADATAAAFIELFERYRGRCEARHGS